MYKIVKVGFLVSLVFFLAFVPAEAAWGSPLNLSLAANKQTYSAGEKILINGNLTLDENPVPDGLVAVQVNDQRGYPRVIRTRPTGANINRHWSVEILNFAPLGPVGEKYSFTGGDDIGFNVTLKNNDSTSHDVKVTVCIYYPGDIPITPVFLWNGTIAGNSTVNVASYPLRQISSTAPLGTATAYANVLSPSLPEDGGFAYSPENAAAFRITTTPGGPPPPQPPPEYTADGTFNLSLRTTSVNARLGNYTVYATTLYIVGPYAYFASNSIEFKVVILGDLNGDGKCDVKDIAIVAKAFGSKPGLPNWNPVADLYLDFKIDIRDVAIVSRDFGKSGIYP